jgi:hypothetical protein
MNAKIQFIFSFFLLLSLACSSTQQIQSDYDVAADFNSYKTFRFLPWYAGNSEYVTEEGKKQLYSMLEEQLTARGYKKVNGNADLTIGLLVLLEEKRDATAYTRYYNTGGFGYYYGFGYGLQSTNYYKKRDFLEGTIIVDIFDHNAKKLIWQGVAIQEIVENKQQRVRQVNMSIQKMFRKFPRK